MTPTPEQVAQWAREAGGDLFQDPDADESERVGVWLFSLEQFHRLVTRAMAEQAEADAKLCVLLKHNRMSNIQDLCAAAIRASAPKVTT